VVLKKQFQRKIRKKKNNTDLSLDTSLTITKIQLSVTIKYAVVYASQ
jgi:hypothetical protein